MSIEFQLFRLQNRLLSYIHTDSVIKRAKGIYFKPKRHQPKEWEESAEVNGTRVTLANGLSALVWGKGVPILFMHGWQGRATQMAGFVEPLNKLGYQVIALDGPAHGKSPGELANPRLFGEAILEADKSFGPFHTVVGHSMGGGATIYALAKGLRTQQIVSISGPSSFKHVSARFADFIGLSRSAKRRFLKAVQDHVGISFEEMDLAKQAENLEHRALIIHDRDDKEVLHCESDRISRMMPNATLYSTVGLGHRKIMRDSVIVDTVVNFIHQNEEQFLLNSL